MHRLCIESHKRLPLTGLEPLISDLEFNAPVRTWKSNIHSGAICAVWRQVILLQSNQNVLKMLEMRTENGHKTNVFQLKHRKFAVSHIKDLRIYKVLDTSRCKHTNNMHVYVIYIAKRQEIVPKYLANIAPFLSLRQISFSFLESLKQSIVLWKRSIAPHPASKIWQNYTYKPTYRWKCVEAATKIAIFRHFVCSHTIYLAQYFVIVAMAEWTATFHCQATAPEVRISVRT